jgi:plasmid stability protein
MGELRIRGVPEGLHKALRKWAIDEDQALEKLVIALLTKAVEKRGK